MLNRRDSLVTLLVISSLSVASAVAPGPPQNLAATVSGNNVTFTFQAPSVGGVPSAYVLEAALSPGGPLIATLPVASSPVVVPNVPSGVYYVAVRGTNGDGPGARSNEVAVSVTGASTGCSSPPSAPENLTGTVAGNLVTLSWTPSSSGCAATAYTVHAGAAPGLSNIAVVNLPITTTLSTSAPSGTYFVRVIAMNGVGASMPSNEVTVRVGALTPPPAPPPPPTPTVGQFAVSTTAASGWTSIEVFANGQSIGTLTRYFDPGLPSSCVPVAGARLVTTVPAGAVTFSARSNTGVTWNGTATVTAGGCYEVLLTCTNRDCSSSPPPPPTTTTYHLWGGPGYAQYLGSFSCTFCREFGSSSVNNEYGSYGSRYSSTSIRNRYSQYGSPYSSYSACNRYASSPPRVYNSSRTIYYGELTINTFSSDAIGAWFSWLVNDVCDS